MPTQNIHPHMTRHLTHFLAALDLFAIVLCVVAPNTTKLVATKQIVLPSGFSFVSPGGYPIVARSLKGDLYDGLNFTTQSKKGVECLGAEDPRCKKEDLQPTAPHPWPQCSFETRCRRV
jgi:hypothetical protein